MTGWWRARGARAVVLTGVLLLVAAACGVSGQDRADVSARDNVPFDLLDPEAEEVASGADPATPGDGVPVYLVQDDRLVAVLRRLPASASLEARLEVLVDGATPGELRAGLQSALVDADVANSVELRGGTATVDLAEAFTDISSRAQPLAIAQIVFTLTERPGVGRVAFTLEEERVEIPRGDGSLVTGSVSRDDYRILAPR